MGQLRLKEVNRLAQGLSSRSKIQIVCPQFWCFLGHLLWIHSVASQQSILGGQSNQVLADLLPVTVIPYFITPKYNSLEKHLRITQSALGAELASE